MNSSDKYTLRENVTLYRVVYWTCEEYKGPKKTILYTLDKKEAYNVALMTKLKTGLRIGIIKRTRQIRGSFLNSEREMK